MAERIRENTTRGSAILLSLLVVTIMMSGLAIAQASDIASISPEAPASEPVATDLAADTTVPDDSAVTSSETPPSEGAASEEAAPVPS